MYWSHWRSPHPLLRTTEGASSSSPGYCSVLGPHSSASVPRGDQGPSSQGCTVFCLSLGLSYTPQSGGTPLASGHHPLTSALTWFPRETPPQQEPQNRPVLCSRRGQRPPDARLLPELPVSRGSREDPSLASALPSAGRMHGSPGKGGRGPEVGAGRRCSRWGPAGA